MNHTGDYVALTVETKALNDKMQKMMEPPKASYPQRWIRPAGSKYHGYQLYFRTQAEQGADKQTCHLRIYI